MNSYNSIFTFIAVCLITCSSCNRPAKLSEADQQLIQETGFDPEILLKIRSYTDSTFMLSRGNPDGEFLFVDSNNYFEFKKKELKGLVFNVSTGKATRIVDKLEAGFERKGYFLYVSESNYGYGPDKVTLIKTSDKFDLLRFEGTNGINYDLYLEDIIGQLREWDSLYELNFTAVGFDFIEAEITRLPKDLQTFCSALYGFCPDIVEQGTGTIEALETEIVNSHKLFLWWD